MNKYHCARCGEWLKVGERDLGECEKCLEVDTCPTTQPEEEDDEE